jgi:hypothetical protein
VQECRLEEMKRAHARGVEDRKLAGAKPLRSSANGITKLLTARVQKLSDLGSRHIETHSCPPRIHKLHTTLEYRISGPALPGSVVSC